VELLSFSLMLAAAGKVVESLLDEEKSAKS